VIRVPPVEAVANTDRASAMLRISSRDAGCSMPNATSWRTVVERAAPRVLRHQPDAAGEIDTVAVATSRPSTSIAPVSRPLELQDAPADALLRVDLPGPGAP
jgi:hypothetical protein